MPSRLCVNLTMNDPALRIESQSSPASLERIAFLLPEKYVLSFIYLYCAWLEFDDPNGFWELRNRLVIRWTRQFNLAVEHLNLFCLQFFIGLVSPFGRKPSRRRAALPRNIRSPRFAVFSSWSTAWRRTFPPPSRRVFFPRTRWEDGAASPCCWGSSVR